jgi:hypothetical protein
METTKMIISVIGLIGIGGLLKSAFDYLFIEKRKRKDQSRHELKDLRYKEMIILCYSVLDYDLNREKLLLKRADIKSREELISEIKLEWINMSLYASDKVIMATKKFIQFNNQDNLSDMVFTMRESLFDIKTSLTSQNLKLE